MENNAASQAALITNTLLQLTNSIKNNNNNNSSETEKNSDKPTNINVKSEASDVQNMLGLSVQNNSGNKPLTIFDRVAYENSKSQQQQIAQLQLNGTWSKFLGDNTATASLNPLEASLPTESY